MQLNSAQAIPWRYVIRRRLGSLSSSGMTSMARFSEPRAAMGLVALLDEWPNETNATCSKTSSSSPTPRLSSTFYIPRTITFRSLVGLIPFRFGTCEAHTCRSPLNFSHQEIVRQCHRREQRYTPRLTTVFDSHILLLQVPCTQGIARS